jgi:PIN domain nuclease of toxin-antitoxin system
LRLLLDTHPLIWFLIDHRRIPDRLMAILTDPARMVHVSAVAVWEATIKVGLGKLFLPLDELEASIAEAGFTVLPVTVPHGLEVRHLAPIHRDPFDRAPDRPGAFRKADARDTRCRDAPLPSRDALGLIVTKRVCSSAALALRAWT